LKIFTMTNFEWLKSLPIKLFADQLIDQWADGTYFSSVCGDLELDGYTSDEIAIKKLVEYLNEEHKETDNIWFSEDNDDYYRDWRN